MKKIFMFCLCLCALFVTGCGCGKKEKMKTISCQYKDETVEEKFTIYFKDDVSDSFDSEQKYIFSSNEQAQIESAYFTEYKTIEVKGNSVIVNRHHDYSDNEKKTYDEILEFYSTYECE